ncbi:MAG: penicillin acylase family protein [Gemmatimonadaceae bacterium]
MTFIHSPEQAMKKLLLALAFASAACVACSRAPADAARWQQEAENVTITRDDWGIPHVKGKTDADAVFGMIYAQAEDDFNRIEVNYLNAMGRLAEAEGEGEIWRDLRMKLFVDTTDMKAQYAASPPWLKTLMVAWADGLNYYLYKHPEVKPRVLAHFEPWMALTFSEGSIGGDIESVSLKALEAFYGGKATAFAGNDHFAPDHELGGSNGFAIAPSNTVNKHALLLINPHTSFYFREELQMASDEGLNAYGAVTWGQFFVYQGFNATAGWMHTSSGADVIDEYAEAITKAGDGYTYKFGAEERPVTVTKVTIPYKTADGMKRREFTVYHTHHGPVVREAGGKWISVKLMQEPVKALTQSYTRTKAKDFKEFRATMELHTNSSNNTIFADAEGNIAYMHANHVAHRDPRLDWTKPVDGSNPATEWGPMYSVEESPFLLNPPNGWLYNTNNWPFSAAGPNSPKRSNYPAYMESYPENPRGIHAIRVLSGRKDFTRETLRDAAYDSYMPALADLVPVLVKSYDRLPAADPLKGKLAEQVQLLRGWDYRWSAESVPTSLAVFWGEAMWTQVKAAADDASMQVYEYIAKKSTPAVQLQALAQVSDKLAADFGTWRTPWGEINRFQRLTDDIVHPFNDSSPSIPVPFASARWGSLASFAARSYKGSRKIYGTSGNSFVAVVEFGDSVRARAVTAGGLNSVVGSKHFDDQAERYAKGDLRDVYFYANQLKGHTERVYKPGAEK